MVLKLSGKWLSILFLATGIYAVLVRWGASPSPQLTILFVLISFAFVTALQQVLRRCAYKRRQHGLAPREQSSISEKEMDHEVSISH